MSSVVEYKDQLYKDIWNGKIPDRVPVSQAIDVVYALQYSNMSLLREQYSLEKIFEAVDKLAPHVDSDIYPMSTSSNIVAMRISGSEVWVMGSNGFLQHPNFAPMDPSEYDFLINDFPAFQAEMDIRSNKAYQCSPEERELVKLRVNVSNMRYFSTFAKKKKEITDKYERSTFEHIIGMTGGPFDNLANGYRAFTGSLNDIRRMPEKVLEAVNILADGNVATIDRMPAGEDGGFVFMPLHMATFMKNSDFEKFWWPFFQRVLKKCEDTNRRIWLFCEDNWDRKIDFLEEVPVGSMMAFEKTDPKLAKEHLGKNHILSGFFPVSMYQSGTEQECIDTVKKYLDILAPGGNYTFKTDKNPISMADAKLENIETVIRTVKEYGKY